jgi:hypothetical protein
MGALFKSSNMLTTGGLMKGLNPGKDSILSTRHVAKKIGDSAGMLGTKNLYGKVSDSVGSLGTATALGKIAPGGSLETPLLSNTIQKYGKA